MPITFQAPEPVAPAASYGYGAAEIGSRNNSVLAGLYSDAARLTSQANLEGARLQQEGAIARSQQETARGDEQARLAEEGRQFDRARLDRQGAQEFDARADFAKQQQRTELAAWLNEQELSQKDELRLRTMRNSVAEIGNDPNLSPDERAAAVAKLKTGIDVYQMRERKALAKQEESRAASYDAAAKRQTEIATQNAAIASKALPDRTNVIYDPQAVQTLQDQHPDWSPEQVQAEARRQGAYSQWVTQGIDQYGEMKGHWVEGHGRQRGAAGGKAERPVTRFGDEHGVFSYQNALKEAQAEAEAAYPVVPKYDGDGKVVDKDANLENRHTYTSEVLKRMKAEHAAQLAAGAGRQVDGPGPGSGQIPPAPQRPFDLAKPEAASPQQRVILKGLDSSLQAVQGRDDLSEAKRARASALITTMRVLLAKGGSFDALEPADKKRVADAMREINDLPPRPTRPRDYGAERQSRYSSGPGVAGAPLGR